MDEEEGPRFLTNRGVPLRVNITISIIDSKREERFVHYFFS